MFLIEHFDLQAKLDLTLPEKNSKTQVASVGYRYRKWDLGNNIRLIARTEHDAVFGTSEKDKSYMNVKALNEWDSRYRNYISKLNTVFENHPKSFFWDILGDF